MKNTDKAGLLDQLARYGYALAIPQETLDPEEVLVALLRQEDARLLEGFPVVLAHALEEKKSLAWESKGWSPQKELPVRGQKRWKALMTLSLLLFRLFGYPKVSANRVENMLGKAPEGPGELGELKEAFSGSGDVRAADLKLSAERLKNNFRNYVVLRDGDKALQEQRDALELELLFSELFTPRQKELLAKRLAGQAFTKTEREYYYRVVKKRLKALADDRVHQTARRLVYS